MQVQGLGARAFAAHGWVVTCCLLASRRTWDQRYVLVAMPKAAPGTQWGAVFQGDDEGVRMAHVGQAPLVRVDQSDPDEVGMPQSCNTRTS